MMRLILSQSAILRNPLGLADAFGLDLGPNFISLELPPLDRLGSPDMMCKEALVVGCTCREDEMFFPITSRQPASWFVGRKLCDFVNTGNGPPFPVSAQYRPLSILQIEFKEVWIILIHNSTESDRVFSFVGIHHTFGRAFALSRPDEPVYRRTWPSKMDSHVVRKDSGHSGAWITWRLVDRGRNRLVSRTGRF